MPEATENLILDVLLTRMQAINGGAGGYNTNPAVKAEGLPPDALPQGAGEAIYIQHVRSTELPGSGSASSHRYRALYHAWCLGDSDRTALNVVADVRRAVLVSEPSFSGTSPYGFRPGDCFTPDPDAITRGKAIRVQEFAADYELIHT